MCARSVVDVVDMFPTLAALAGAPTLQKHAARWPPPLLLQRSSCYARANAHAASPGRRGNAVEPGIL